MVWGLLELDEDSVIWEDPITADLRFLKGYVEGLLSLKTDRTVSSGHTCVFYKEESKKS